MSRKESKAMEHFGGSLRALGMNDCGVASGDAMLNKAAPLSVGL